MGAKMAGGGVVEQHAAGRKPTMPQPPATFFATTRGPSRVGSVIIVMPEPPPVQPLQLRLVAFVVPIGFVCEHVKVLYDLDVEARKVAEELGLRFHRAAPVNDHPSFIEMLADLVRQGPSM